MAINTYPYTSSNVSQQATVSTVNSSSTNLAAGNSYTFTGTSASTLGVNSIQVSLFADKNCKVKIQQSPDGTNWDLVDTYYYTASSTSFGVTVQAISSYFRTVVTTNAETTTTFRLQSVLCPIADPLPRSLTGNGALVISSPLDAYGFKAENTPMGDQRVVEPVRLVGAGFEGSTIDSRFWTSSATGGAGGSSIAQASAQVLITSGTANADTVTLYSNRRARYVGGSSQRYRAVVQVSASKANNVRRWGVGYGATMPTITDGAWFQWNGTTFNVVIMKGTSATTVSSFNGNLGATYDPGTSVKTYEIYWTNSKVYFVIGDELLHVHSASTATWSATMNFHIFADSVNSAILDASTTLAIRVATICRLGKYETQPIYYNLTGNAATHTLKLGPGILHKIMFNNTSGTSVAIYDNTSAATPLIGTITTASAALGEWDYGCPFNTGLVLVTTGNGLDATIVYE